jgi:hypothetical protein
MNGWDNNKKKAAQLYSQNGNGDKCGLFNNVEKAIRIYNGEDALDVLGGNKVRSFYLAILHPTGDFPVVDRHAFDIAVGMETDDKARRMLDRKGEYERFSDTYREAASVANIATPQIQAVTWIQWRIEKGVDWY